VAKLVEAGADVNAEDNSGQMPLGLALARNSRETADYLRQHGAKEPETLDDRLRMYRGESEQAAPTLPVATSVAPLRATVLDDPNAIRAKVQSFEGLDKGVEAVDANSASEVRGWLQRRSDNRTSLVRATEKQFAQELAFVKKVATAEKAQKTIAAIDTLAAAREKRYEAISKRVREARREEMRSQSATRGRGRYSRGRRSAGDETGDMGQGMYANPGAAAVRPRGRNEAEEPPLDPVTEAQVQAWIQAKPEDKDRLLDAVHKLDIGEFEGLRQVAEEEGAKKTTAAIEGVMLARDERAAKIRAKWVLDDERMQRLEERQGGRGGRGRGMTGTQQQDQMNQNTRGRRGRYR
jgi:hypothetical protein